MTEDEAKTKVCCGPQTVAMVIGLAAPKLVAEVTPDAGRCIGSQCMAWRESRRKRGPVVERRPVVPGSKRPDGDDWGYEQRDLKSSATHDRWVRYDGWINHGFCGLAGRPE